MPKKLVPKFSSKDVLPGLGIAHGLRFLDKGNKKYKHYTPVWSKKGGFDSMFRDGVGITAELVETFFAGRDNRTIAELEDLIRKNAGEGRLDTANIHKLNGSILTYPHSKADREAIFTRLGLPLDTQIFDAASLNDLDDYADSLEEDVEEPAAAA